MAPITPNARTWTLRLKHHKTTLLLHVDPIQKLSSLRAELLSALHQTNPSGNLDGHKIPQNADEIVLAKPVDANDLSLGWERLEMKGMFGAEQEESGKGKGKAAASVTSTPGAGAKAKAGASGKMTDCPQGSGLRDGGIVAFRFKSEEDGSDEANGNGAEAEDEDIEVAEEDKRGVAPERWDVVVPTIEETYAEEDASRLVAEEGNGG